MPVPTPRPHPATHGDVQLECAAAMSMLRSSGHEVRQVFAVDLDRVAYVSADGCAMTAILEASGGGWIVSTIEKGWVI